MSRWTIIFLKEIFLHVLSTDLSVYLFVVSFINTVSVMTVVNSSISVNDLISDIIIIIIDTR